MRQAGAANPGDLRGLLRRHAPLLLLAGTAFGLRLAGHTAAAALLGLAALAACFGRYLRFQARLALGAGVVVLSFGFWYHPLALASLVRLLPALGMLLMAAHFGLTLRPGQEPLIARYTRYDPGVDLTECASYARGLTWFWTIVFLLLTPLYAMAFLGTGEDGAIIMTASGALMLLLFLGEHVVRTLRFPHFGLATPVRTLRAVIAATVARHA
ncbi:hypothetical protein HMPREF9946_01626 [Acetobacteraceae bacterium AT-5844]|nr:hypothetical protein HMPREF9946_01626 [Acetobacteraceae bacterium AT-5844]